MATLQRTTAEIRADHGPLPDPKRVTVMFLHTTVGVGGAESLLLDLIRRLDRTRFAPELCCLKGLGGNGEVLAREIPAFHGLIRHKCDAGVIFRLARLMRRRRVDAIVTVGAGDKMFWGRIAARLAGVPVVIAAIHSTGWPDRIGRLNRLLTCWTDAFVALAGPHRRYLVDDERLPAAKVRIIPNGIDVDRFFPRRVDESRRREVGLRPGAPVVGIVARLRSEKNIELFLDVATKIRREIPTAQFLIVGDGPDRAALEERSRALGLADCVRFVGNRIDVPELLALMNVFVLTSHIEASPVSILEAFAMGKPVVATRVGSVAEAVRDGENGYLAPAGDGDAIAVRTVELLQNPAKAATMGMAGREFVVQQASVDVMVSGYEHLIGDIYFAKHPALASSAKSTTAELPALCETIGENVNVMNT
jgi:glycosyltransferase involved in cell wall biosynthesis